MPATTARYQFYREHLNTLVLRSMILQRLIGKTDFRAPEEVAKVMHTFDEVMQMLKGHAHYEEESLQVLLKQKNSAIFARVHADHAQLDGNVAYLKQLLEKTLQCSTSAEQVETGYQFYLEYMKFCGR